MKVKPIKTPVSVLKAATPTIDNQAPVSLINSTSEHINALPVRFLRKKEVIHLTGLSSANLYLLMSKNLFPQSVKLSEKSVAWVLSEVESWQVNRLATRHQAANNAKGLSHE